MDLKRFITTRFFVPKQEGGKENMSTPATTTGTCLHCQTPIEQPMHGGRPRKFCKKAACRKAESRAQKQAELRKTEQEQKEALEKTWLQFDSETREYLRAMVEEEGLTKASRATDVFIRLLAKEKQQQEQATRKDSSSPQKVPAGRALDNASIADLMKETAARLNTLSSETPEERDAFVARHGLLLGNLYAEMVPYLIESPERREMSLKLAKTTNKR